MSAAEAKAQLGGLTARVAYGAARVVIERHGQPIAALVSIGDLGRLEAGDARAASPIGALALVGAWSELSDEEIDAFIEDVYAARERDAGRPVNLEQ